MDNGWILTAALLALAGPAFATPVDGALRVDLNGDGKAEAVTVKQSPKTITLDVQSNVSGEPQTLEFGVDRARQDAVCKSPVELKVVDLLCDPMDEPLSGCKVGNGAKGLILVDGECDPIQLYWDHENEKLTWWRL
ncbi:hypothetical protein LK996_00800 [Lysobacter sp. A6]|uniref:Uncharacterized protein n=1 Tax=Noviluteimonas lactosilytica TaxID=2888523 RepID=A0ABS8JDK4_9GAMM|nr:hypothetical protein [Lysobacter lactosilyticus]MCC8361622.1 hypothetical protein [Lysobacter lactosilyticus]